MNIKSIDCTRLRNDEHFQFFTEVKDLLFKTGDSLFCKSDNEKTRLSVYGASNIRITPDTLGLIIYAEGEVDYLYPLSKRDTLFEIFSLTDNSFTVLEKKIYIDFEEVSFAAIEVQYNNNGDVIFKPDSATAYNVDYEAIYKFPKELLEDKDELKFYFINSQAYTIGNVINEARNAVRFKENFENRQNYYKLKVTAINDFGTEYRVDGENFSFFTKDKQFARLRYPNEIIIKATVSDIRSAKENLYGAYMFGVFNVLSGGRGNPKADFMFENCELIYYYE